MKTPVAVCENDSCEKVIHDSERVWQKGSELFCSGKCLIESFGSPVEPLKLQVLREKHITKQSSGY
jgi:hypothetical protein